MSHDDRWHPSTVWRPLTENERLLLEALTSQSFAGAEGLRRQIQWASAQPGCGCGCGTINLRCDEDQAEPAPVAKSPVPGEAHVLDDRGDVIGGLLLFARNGYLSALEIFTFGDPGPLPSADRIRPYIHS